MSRTKKQRESDPDIVRKFSVLSPIGKRSRKYTKDQAIQTARLQKGTSYVVEDWKGSERVVAVIVL